MADIHCDILIVGASLGGVAAALRAGSLGAAVCLVEASGWVGGQMTAQGVCTPDENEYVESAGSTNAYRNFRQRVREYYRANYRLSASGAGQPNFNAGNCWVNMGFSVEPLLGDRLLKEMLAEIPSVTLSLNTTVTGADVEGDTIASVSATGPDGSALRFLAPVVLDATDLGDLLPLVGAEWLIGAESSQDTQEPDAPADAHPNWIQPFTFPFALERRPRGEDHTIAKPDGYDQWKAEQGYRIQDGAIRNVFTGPTAWWTYRRVINAANFDDPAYPCDIATINTGANDFHGGAVPSGSAETDASTLAQGGLASLGFVYWLQTECPRDDAPGELGYPELKLRPDLFGTDDGMSPAPYIRESRRIRALYAIGEKDILRKYNPGPRAQLFADTLGIGDYAADVHAGSEDPGLWEPAYPFQIPLRALVPVRVTNLIASCKNIGTTHITNGAYRVHPSEWAVGEAAGALGAFCARQNAGPAQVAQNADGVRAIQKALIAAGAPLFWWIDVPSNHPAFAATQLLGIAQIFTGNGRDLNFDVDAPFKPDQQAAVASRIGRDVPWPGNIGTRGEAAVWLAEWMGL